MTKRVKQKIGRGVTLTSVALALFFFTLDVTGQDLAHFKLFADCQPMQLIVEDLRSDASDIGLTKASIQAAAESRLRSARLYDSDPLTYPYLYINVNVVGRAFNIGLEYSKPVYDPLSDSHGVATTWNKGMVGTHGGDAGYILSSISELMDTFLVEFLRVNEEAC